jgi:hypothetical protein
MCKQRTIIHDQKMCFTLHKIEGTNKNGNFNTSMRKRKLESYVNERITGRNTCFESIPNLKDTVQLLQRILCKIVYARQ